MQFLDSPIICPILVGRGPHSQALDRYLGEAAEGRGQTLLVTGEAGVGKSRLVSEARGRAERLGAIVLEGRCFESYRSFPYAPLIDLLRSGAQGSPDRLAELLGPSSVELARIMPELAALKAGREQPPDPGHSELEKYQLFQALTEAVRRLASNRLALVIMEDAHWSDDASLDFLGALAREIGTLPILLLVTYRDDEISPALARLLAELDRGRLAAELRLARLNRAEVDEMLQSIWGLDRPIRPDFLDAIFSLTDGNPFFIEEVVRSLVATGDLVVSPEDGVWDYRSLSQLRVPRTVQDAVERRAAQLSEAARSILRLAAVAGQRFDIELLERLLGVDETVLLRSIKELLSAGLLIEESAERFAFRHALTREAVRSGLLARELRSIHQAIGEAIEDLHAGSSGSSDAHFGDLAYHFSEAGIWDKVLLYAPRAGEQAQALWAPRAAVDHFTRALEATRQLGHQPPLQMLRARGQAYETLGEFEPARADLEAFLERARVQGDREAEWQALLDLGGVWLGHRYERVGEYYRAALDLARESADGHPRQLAHSLNRLGNWHMNLEEPAQAAAYHREALALFVSLDDRGGVAETLDHLGMASFLAGDLLGAQEYYERAIPLLRDLDQRQRLASALATLAISGDGHAMLADLMVLPPPSEPNAAQRHAEEALQIAHDIGWRAGQAYALNCLAGVFLTTGRITRGVERAEAALRIAEELEHSEWMVHALVSLGTMYLDVLALPDARAQFDRAVSLALRSESRYWVRFASAGAALTYAEQGDFSPAAALLDGLVDLSRPPETWAERAVWYVQARIAQASGDPNAALRLADEVIASDPHATPDRPIRRLEHLRGQALAALGQLAGADEALQRAARAAGPGARSSIWRIQADLAWVRSRQGRRRDAQATFAEARAHVDDMLPDIPAHLRESFLKRATEMLPEARGLTPRQAAREASGGLTARERDVAALVSRGLSNREIADALVLGERTVQTHVGHILNKLGFSSRAQIAAWAAERGLTSEPQSQVLDPIQSRVP
jgi:DNA-binding CsgD family transcriptional regulator